MITTLAIGLLMGHAIQKPGLIPEKPVPFAIITDINDKGVSLKNKKVKATVMFFIAVDCPIANRMAPEIARIQKDFADKKVQTILVYPEPTLTKSDITKHLKDFRLSGYATIDKTQEIRRAVGVTVTPQAVILNSEGKVVYLGRINDLFEEHGKVRAKITRQDLRIALTEMLGGTIISQPYTQPVGCFLGD